MSHFAVMVKVTKEKLAEHGGDMQKALGAILAPYQENNMGDCPKEYLEFNDMTDECRKEWETESDERIVLESGELVPRWDERFRVKGGGLGSDTHKPPERLERRQVPHKEMYPDFGKYVEKYHGYKLDPEKNRYGYWENPNRKWGWWVLGGRYRGWLPVKEGARTAPWAGVPGTFGNENIREGGVDALEFKNFDWEKFAEEADQDARKFYENLVAARDRDHESKEFRDFWLHNYHSLSELLFIREKKEVNDDGKERTAVDWENPLNDRAKTITLEEVLKHKHRWGFCTFAVVTEDGKWIGKGDMGWFGCSSETAREGADWTKHFADNFILGTDPETYLAVVDCHI